ncbi:thioredoxin fold domain-containing protein [Thiomonas sp.]
MNRILGALGGRLARYLAAPSHCARAMVPTDVRAMRAAIRPGDVLLVEGNSRLSSAIKYLTHSNWSHAALYVGEDQGGFIEADVVEGARAVGWSEFEGMGLRLCRPVALRPDDAQRVIAAARARLGHRYDLRNIVDLARHLLPTPPVRVRVRILSLDSGAAPPYEPRRPSPQQENRMRRRQFFSLVLAPVLCTLVGRTALAQNSAAAKALAEIGKATVITEGSGPRVLTVFFDPNCPYCRQLYSSLRPYVGKDGLQVDWVPVAILAPSSAAKAAAILQAKDRLQAFRATEDHGLDPNRPAPTLPSAGQITAATRQILTANARVLKQTGVYESVPLAVYRDRNGQPQLEMGTPRGQAALSAWLQSIGP